MIPQEARAIRLAILAEGVREIVVNRLHLARVDLT